MTEEEKALSGHLFSPGHPELLALKRISHNLCQQFNACPEGDPLREALFREIVTHVGRSPRINSPLWFNYGCHTTIGHHFFSNVNFVVQDDAAVTIGDHFMAGPNVSLVTPLHPLVAQERLEVVDGSGHPFAPCYAKPISIGHNVWLAANVTVCPGVTIGNNVVVAAGSVVIHDLPDNVLAGGVPCQVIREITDADSVLHRLAD